jgi:hypothetical protein
MHQYKNKNDFKDEILSWKKILFRINENCIFDIWWWFKDINNFLVKSKIIKKNYVSLLKLFLVILDDQRIF